jgi:hypothetical protein
MAKKITLDQKIDALTNIVEKGFAAVAEDISKLATKEQLAELQTQVNSIEQQLRETKIEVRLGALETKSSALPAANPPTATLLRPHKMPWRVADQFAGASTMNCRCTYWAFARRSLSACRAGDL